MKRREREEEGMKKGGRRACWKIKITYYALIQLDKPWPPMVVDDDDAC